MSCSALRGAALQPVGLALRRFGEQAALLVRFADERWHRCGVAGLVQRDVAGADQERDEALAKVAALESELAVLREVVAERARLLQEVRELRAEALPLREQVARLTATGEHLAVQLQDTKAELKEAREDGRQLQTELLALARQEGKVKK